eukprot:gb/GECG01015141.1/.p1 GENE.gb/GECG01015141.1/~~gb/GECG01015141.1/.p1  ORF type:complete len:209 (+),score=31.91 gb/GECG01015141.1/:1-627(+)
MSQQTQTSSSSNSNVPDVTGPANERGIPSIKFIEDVPKFLERENTTIEGAIEAMQTLHSKYKLMESHLLENRKRVNGKLPDIDQSLEMIYVLKDKQAKEETIHTHYSLSDNVNAQATVKPDNRVCLWLGANVMVEYNYDEAVELLERNQQVAQKKLKEIKEDLDFLRDNKITAEVNIARIFNYDVKLRKEQVRRYNDINSHIHCSFRF